MIKRNLFLLITILILLSVSYIIWGKRQYLQENPENGRKATSTIPNITLKNTPVDSNNWNIYIDETYGFEFKYPRYWSLASSSFQYGYKDFLDPELMKLGNNDRYNTDFFATNLTLAVYDRVEQMPVAGGYLEKFDNLENYMRYILERNASGDQQQIKVIGKYKLSNVDAYETEWLGGISSVRVVTFEHQDKIIGLYFGQASDEVRNAVLTTLKTEKAF
jgi:hypothetical protein